MRITLNEIKVLIATRFEGKSRFIRIEAGENDAGLQHIYILKCLTKPLIIFTLLTNVILGFLG